MKWWSRLSFRLTFFILFLAVVPLTLLGVSTLKDIRRVRLQSVAQIHDNIARQAVSKIENSLLDTIKEIQLVADSTALESADISDQEWFLQLLIKNLPYLFSVTVADTKGQGNVKVGRDSAYSRNDLGKHNDHPDVQDAGNSKPIIGALHAAENQILLLDIYVPLLSPMDRNVSAILVAEIDIKKLLKFTTDILVGETGYIYVVNKEGKILVYPDHSAVLAGEDGLSNPLVQDFVAGRNTFRSNEKYFNRKNIEVLTNVQMLTEPRLLVVVAQSVDEAMAAVTRISNRQRIILLTVLVIVILFALYFTIKTIKPLNLLALGAQQIGAGVLSHRIAVTTSDELGTVTRSFNFMAEELETAKVSADKQNWLKQGVAEMETRLRGDLSLEEICFNVLSFMATFLQQQVGIFYANDGRGIFRYRAGYAFQPGKQFLESFEIGQGLPGEAAREKRILTVSDIPAERISINAGLGNMIPRQLTFIPFMLNGQVEAVMELGSLHVLTDLQKMFFQEITETVAIKLASVRARQELSDALVQTRQQAEELNRQQEELQAANEEMEEQTQLLIESESKLKEQGEELQASNEELEEKTEYLERNKRNIEEKNQVLEQLKKDLEDKAADLTTASRYKSEFLANMSHELRTPLNSLLLLAKLLADNKEGNLSEEQMESAQIIYNSGDDLLNLINEILDLSKIEAGKMQLNVTEIALYDLGDSLSKNFRSLAEKKGLSLIVSNRLPALTVINSDRQRILQILKNFISNALKFTTQGGVTIDIYQPDEKVVFSRPGLCSGNSIALAVDDTGIGIPHDKQKIIFEAFQQLEGGSARKYEGTGLGLSISRELANLLGGEIQLYSEENVGSTFTLYLPKELSQASSQEPVSLTETSMVEEKVMAPAAFSQSALLTNNPASRTLKKPEDDRNSLHEEDNIVLIIEDDINFATTLQRFCRERGFKCLVELTGEEGLQCAQKYPVKAIILDINLPGIDGWTVLEYLKDKPSTRHIPVQFMSADDPVPAAFNKGAIGYLTKPVKAEDLDVAMKNLESMIDKKMKELLLVEDNENQRLAIIKLISDSNLAIKEVSTGKEAIAALQEKKYDCMILDLGLPDMNGFELLRLMEGNQDISVPPVVIYTGKDLTQDEELELRKYSESIIIKGVRSEERLLDETSLFLHQVVEKMPVEKRKIINALHDTDQILRGRNILIVDDDMRNVFALSRVLHEKGISSIKAENGMKALEILDTRFAEVDLILMDIMMPIMDGYETMRQIRQNSKFGKLPIIALTAKAMQRDKDDSIAAGANDYLAKPVDVDRLLSMMRVWLYR